MKREPRRRYRASPLTWGSIGQKMPDWQSSQPRDQGTDATRKPTRPSGWLPGGRRPARRKSLDALPPRLVGNTGHSPSSSPPCICVSARPVPCLTACATAAFAAHQQRSKLVTRRHSHAIQSVFISASQNETSTNLPLRWAALFMRTGSWRDLPPRKQIRTPSTR